MIKISIIGLFLILFLIACDEENSTSAIENDTDNRNLKISIEHQANGQQLLISSTTFTNQSGNQLNLSRLRYFISNIELTDENNEIIKLEDILFIDLEEGNSTFDLKDVPNREFKSIKFYVGVDSLTNHSDPNTYEPNSPLNPVNNDMHWSWMNGYIFLSMEGVHINSGTLGTSAYSYHIGKMPNLMVVNLGPEKSIINDDSINIIFDIVSIFDNLTNIDVGINKVTHSSVVEGQPDLANILSKNIQGSFVLK